MADDYIRREDVLKGQKTGAFANGICFEAKRCVTVEYIESIEPADVVQVVRCRDCKYHSYDEEFCCYWCEHIFMAGEVKPDFYCACGEE